MTSTGGSMYFQQNTTNNDQIFWGFMYKRTKVGIIHEIAPTRQKSGLWPLQSS